MDCSLCPCCPCCYRRRAKKERYAHIVYQSPDTANENVDSHRSTPVLEKDFSFVHPLGDYSVPDPEKDFNFVQPLGDYSVHPQVGGGMRPEVISTQPYSLMYQWRRRSSLPAVSDVVQRPQLRAIMSEQSSLGPRRFPLQPQARVCSSEDVPSFSRCSITPRSPYSSGHLSQHLPDINEPTERGDSQMQKATKYTSAASFSEDEEHVPIVLNRKSTMRAMVRRRSSNLLSESWIPDLPVIEQSNLSSDEEEFLSFLQFSLFYDVHRRILSVNLQEAINLPGHEQHRCDPFVVLHLSPSKEEIFESSIKQKTLNPKWDETFDFVNQTAVAFRQQDLVFRVYDNSKYSRNSFIGAVLVPLVDADLYGMSIRMIIDQEAEKFREESRGDLLISLTYNPELNLLEGVILRATNLQKQDLTGLADPYVKVNMMCEGKTLNKWKSSVKKNTLIPVFNESFQFDTSGLSLEEIVLQVRLMDYDRFSRDDQIGTILIGETVEQELGREHWEQVMESPHQPVTLWHPVLPAPPQD